jgi:hypothetical protein
MIVIDFEDRAWYLLEHEGEYLIDVNCNSSAFGFSIIVKLNEKEKTNYLMKGHDFIHDFAKYIAYHGFTKFEKRNVRKDFNSEVSEAIKKWKSKGITE